MSLLRRFLPIAGKNFSYLEVQKVPNRFAAYMGSFVFAVVGLLISRPILRSTWLKILPKPGSMPPEEKMKKGTWTNTLVGVPEGQESKRVKVEMKVCPSRSLHLCKVQSIMQNLLSLGKQ